MGSGFGVLEVGVNTVVVASALLSALLIEDSTSESTVSSGITSLGTKTGMHALVRSLGLGFTAVSEFASRTPSMLRSSRRW